MKVYRVVPEVLSYRPYGSHYDSLESLYYELGYISFNGCINEGYGNNICDRVKTEGKYFFIFLEDAAFYITQNLREVDTWKLMEYDFPEEVVYSIIGWGGYGYDLDLHLGYNKRAETYIEKSRIPGVSHSSSEISREKKEVIMISDYRRSYATEVEYERNNNVSFERDVCDICEDPYTYFLEWLKETYGENYADVNSLTDEDIHNMIDERALGPLINNFLIGENEIIKTPAITGKSAILLYEWTRCEIPQLFKYNTETLIKSGFNPDYSKDGVAARQEYTRLIEEKQIKKAKKLLKEYRG